jgi:hypothetical protein
MTLPEKEFKHKGLRVWQVVECLCNKNEDLSLNPSTANEKKGVPWKDPTAK